MCTVCDHPNRQQIEDSLRRGEPIDRIARLQALSATAVRRHRDGNHAVTRPIPIKKPNPNPWPSDDEIRGMNTRQDRTRLLVRYFAERRWQGGKTIAFLAHLWRPYFGWSAESMVADLAGEAAATHAKLRGSRAFRHEEMIVRLKRIGDKAENAGEYAAALVACKQEAELDGLTYEPGMLSALVEAQTWRLVQPLLQQKYPQAMKEIASIMASADNKRSKAKKLLSEGPTFADVVSDGSGETKMLEEGETEEAVVIDDNSGSKDETRADGTPVEETREEA